MKIRYQLLLFMFLRTILNTAHRMVYPFLSIFARGLGVDIATLSLFMTGRSLIAASSPLFAPIADVRGRRFGMLLGVTIFTLAAVLLTLYPSVWTFAAILGFGIIGKFLFDLSMQAYFGDRIPYERRGTALAVTEVSWSLAFIAGVPAASILIARYGWTAPYPVYAVLGIGMLYVIWRVIPHEDSHHVAPTTTSAARYRAVFSSSYAMTGLSIALFASAGNEVLNIIFGVWLEDSFGLKIAALAGASAVIGLSELSGEGLVALTTDKLGKPLALAIGLIGNALAAAALPLIGRSEVGALIGLFFFYLTFEYLIVSHIPLVTELVPSARATILSVNVTGHSAGRAIGALLAGLIYQRFGFGAIALTTVLFNLAALLALRKMLNVRP